MILGGRGWRRRGAATLAAGLLLALGGCRSAEDKANAYETLYDQLMPNKAYPAALTSIRAAVKADESEPRRWLKLGQVLLLLNQPAQAAEALQHALDLQPDNVTAMENLAVLAVRGNQFEMARHYAEPLLLIQPTNLGGLLTTSMIALHEHRYADADRIADQLIATYPEREDGTIIKARVLDASGRTRAAAALLAARAAKQPDGAQTGLSLLRLYQKLGDMQGVRDVSLRLATLFPDQAPYLLESARAWHARGQDAAAGAAIARAVARFGGNPAAMGVVADYWRDTLPIASARARVRALATTASPAVRVALASRLAGMGDAAGAVALLAPLAPATVTVDNADAQGRYARALLEAGRMDAAAAKAEALLGFDPASPDGLLVRARIALAKGDARDALTDAQLVARDDRRNEEAALLIAQAYAALGNRTLAGSAFADARNQFPDSSNALRAETQWLAGQKRMDEALDRAASFTATHPRRGDGWALYADLCARARDAACLAAARRALAPGR